MHNIKEQQEFVNLLKSSFEHELVAIIKHKSSLLTGSEQLGILLVFNNNLSFSNIQQKLQSNKVLNNYFLQHLPLIFTLEELADSRDIFPIEFYEMLDTAETLFGNDLSSFIKISSDNLRLQIESNLRRNIILLRKEYPVKTNVLSSFVCESFNNTLVTFRNILRLKKLLSTDITDKEIIEKICGYYKIEPFVFLSIFYEFSKPPKERLKDNKFWEDIFSKYLANLSLIVKDIDSCLA